MLKKPVFYKIQVFLLLKLKKIYDILTLTPTPGGGGSEIDN